MPYDDPKYSISVIIEHGGSGASTAAAVDAPDPPCSIITEIEYLGSS